MEPPEAPRRPEGKRPADDTAPQEALSSPQTAVLGDVDLVSHIVPFTMSRGDFKALVRACVRPAARPGFKASFGEWWRPWPGNEVAAMVNETLLGRLDKVSPSRCIYIICMYIYPAATSIRERGGVCGPKESTFFPILSLPPCLDADGPVGGRDGRGRRGGEGGGHEEAPVGDRLFGLCPADIGQRRGECRLGQGGQALPPTQGLRPRYGLPLPPSL